MLSNLNFYDSFQFQCTKATKMGFAHVFMSVSDAQKERGYEDVGDTLQILKDKGHAIRMKRMDSSNDFGFFGVVLWISVKPSETITLDETQSEE